MLFGIAVFLDLIRALSWPFPWGFCIIVVYIKNFAYLNIGLITLTMTTTRFVFIFFFKRLPIIEDKFWANLFYAVTSMISLLATASKFYLPGRQTMNEVYICMKLTLQIFRYSNIIYKFHFTADLYRTVL